jgi:hypothetical protein
MKRINFSIGIIMAAAALLLFSCEEKKEEVDELVGKYVFGSATFNEEVTIIIEQQQVTFPAESDATDFVSEGLLGAAPCDDTDNAAVELKADGTTHYICQGETNQEQLGTWAIKSDRTVLTLNISNPTTFSLNISDLVVTETSFSGTVTNFPLPVDASVELGGSLPGGLVNYQIASVDVSFTRLP